MLPQVELPSLRAFLGAIALKISTSSTTNRGLKKLEGGLTQNDVDVRTVANAVIDAFDAVPSNAAPGPIGGTTPSTGKFTTITVTGTAGNTFTIDKAVANFQVVHPAKDATAASQAGATDTFTAQSATAGSSVAGAAAGGGWTFATGSAARLTSGDAAGGILRFSLGSGVGSGAPGIVRYIHPSGSLTSDVIADYWTNGATKVHEIRGDGIRYTGSVKALLGGVPNFGRASVVMPTDANYTVLNTEYQNHILVVTSSVALTASRNFVLPLVDGALLRIKNSTTGGQMIAAIGPTGTGQLISNGAIATVYCDGVNYYAA